MVVSTRSKCGALLAVVMSVSNCAGHDDKDATASTSASLQSAPGVPHQTAVVPLEVVGSLQPPADVYVTLESPDVSCEATCIGEFWLQELNSENPPRNVRALDLSSLSEEAIRMAMGAGAGEIVLRGELGPGTFFASEAWRGLPGVQASPSDVYVTVEATGKHRLALVLDGPLGRPIESLALASVGRPWVDAAWISNRIMEHGAIVAGTFNGWALDADQVFLRLPDVIGPCDRFDFASICGADLVATYSLDDGLCPGPTGCAKPGFCPQLKPFCDPGYDLVSTPSQPDACPAFTCEPAFAQQ